MHDNLSDIFSPLPGSNKLNELTYLSALVLSFPYCRSMVDSSQPKLSISAMFTTQMSSSCEENFVFVLERPEKCSDLFDYIDESDYLSENEGRQFISNILDATIYCEDMVCFIKTSSPNTSSLICPKWSQSGLTLVLLMTYKTHPSGDS